MAITKSGMRKQVVENLTQVAPPGEQFIACVHGMTGPSPWFEGLFGAVGALIVQSFRRYYFVTLTSTSVVINRAGRIANRPKEIVAAIPLTAGAIDGIHKGKLWGKIYIWFPGDTKATKINVNRVWNADLDRFAAATAPYVRIPAAASGDEPTGARAGIMDR